ncbi:MULTISPECIES: aldehyde dehydrogenase family protein [unclassified Rhizobium]|uniref:aldehyde dehydrogenase family protein n=1 Tax=unclassified Rhizobium TaxID=2613769 RepID=UPI00071598F9|nr:MULTISPECIES: aldehyde dehydrogenase family protein [unclassified Rhizobium]KQS83769.1 aldehyde dehydrogenase [Rhizobium sp. Leaf386]KQT04906.1 aldehyde dehydrogenase [Rhizobium sp. Leaf391]KQU08709.1 aldehyde dehydrogenase [Rhizobium sp. Leaf453]
MQDRLYIDGEWVTPERGGTFDVINPATEEVIHKAPAGTSSDIDKAVKAARYAFDTGPWPHFTGAERAVYLRAIATKITEKREFLAKLEVLDNGKPLPEALWDIDDVAGCFTYYAGLAEELDAHPEETIPLSEPRFSSRVVREPIGVVGAITPWNYPLLMVAWKVAPALAAGCTMVLKPSELTPLTALELGVIAEEAGLPAGVLNIVTGTGMQAGEPLTEHPLVDKLAFTGSVSTGRKVMMAGAQDIKNVSLELGGKSPFVIFADSDIEKAVEWIMFGIFWNQGQVCSATSRVLVEASIYDAVLSRLCEEAAKIRIGNGMEDGTLLGPIVSKGQYDKILSAIEHARIDGATVSHGGGRPAGLNSGYFLEPTVLTGMSEGSYVWKEEIFGPVVCVKPFKDEDDAIRMANDSRFGLAAAVMSKDVIRAERVAEAFRAGIVWVNCSQPTFVEAPWGGYKQSGIGRELGRWGLSNYLETKQITRFNSDEPWGWYIKN